jgi:activator-of-BECN1-regulated-autophagy protein 1
MLLVHPCSELGDITQNLFVWAGQIYRVSDMELVRVLPSSEDEVNVACFHPSPGGGLVYGTKVNHIESDHYRLTMFGLGI